MLFAKVQLLKRKRLNLWNPECWVVQQDNFLYNLYDATFFNLYSVTVVLLYSKQKLHVCSKVKKKNNNGR